MLSFLKYLHILDETKYMEWIGKLQLLIKGSAQMPHPPASPPLPLSATPLPSNPQRERERAGGRGGAVSTSWLPQSPPSSSTTIAIRDTITAGLLCRPETGKHLTTPPKCHQLPLPAIGYASKWFFQIQEKTFPNTRKNFCKYKRKLCK